MGEYGPPRPTTEAERKQMAHAARQHLTVMRIDRHEKAQPERGPKCVVCRRVTEYGCPDCPVTLCNPYLFDCYTTHAKDRH